ncbi:MAG: hypothetical protein AAGB22_10205, partial [Bacteroidota bacterium]
MFMVCVLLSGGALTAHAQDNPKKERKVTYDFSGNVEGAFRFFLEEGAFPGQKRSYFSGSATPELEIGWDKGDQTLNITLFGRLDQHDSQRTHADIREFYYQIAKNSWEFSAGLKKVF